MKAQTWLPEPLQSEETEHVVSAGAADGPTLVLQLEARRILTARLVLPSGLDMPESVDFRLRKLEGTDDVDPATLRAGESQRRSRNLGATWQKFTAGLPDIPRFSDILVDPASPDTIYAAVKDAHPDCPVILNSVDEIGGFISR